MAFVTFRMKSRSSGGDVANFTVKMDWDAFEALAGDIEGDRLPDQIIAANPAPFEEAALVVVNRDGLPAGAHLHVTIADLT